jgi:hypothetical protein
MILLCWKRLNVRPWHGLLVRIILMRTTPAAAFSDAFAEPLPTGFVERRNWPEAEE